jgi:hypothetical protein
MLAATHSALPAFNPHASSPRRYVPPPVRTLVLLIIDSIYATGPGSGHVRTPDCLVLLMLMPGIGWSMRSSSIHAVHPGLSCAETIK